MGFPGASYGKESSCSAGFDPWVGKIPWRRAWQPTPVALPGEYHGQKSLVGYSPRGHQESYATEHLSTVHRTVKNAVCVLFPPHQGAARGAPPSRHWLVHPPVCQLGERERGRHQGGHGPWLRLALAGREAEGTAGIGPAWPAAPGTCHPCVFAQRVGRGSRMLSVGPWAFRAPGASCWGWHLL